MKHLLILTALMANLLLSSCGQNGGKRNGNEDPAGSERGTPGTRSKETGTGQDHQHHIEHPAVLITVKI